MRAGRLRHKLWLKSPTNSNNTAGTVVTTYGTVAVLWGSIEPIMVGTGGQEFYDSALVNSEATSKIIIRYTSAINTSYRIIFGTRTFEIISVINVAEKDKEMQLMVKEEVII